MSLQCNAIIEEEDMTKYLTIADVDEKLREHEQQHQSPLPPPEFTTLKKSDILNEAIKVNMSSILYKVGQKD